MSEPVLTVYSNAMLGSAAEDLLRQKIHPHRLIDAAVTGKSNLHVGGADPAAANADVAFGQPAVDDILRNPRLKYVHLTSAGWDRYDREDVKTVLRSRGGCLCSASSVYAEPCAEHALSLMLAYARRLPVCLLAQQQHTYPKDEIRAESKVLTGKTALIVGFGAIGRRLAELLAPFRMKVVAVRQTVRGDEGIETIPITDLDRVLDQADHVINILPGGKGTEQFFNADRFGRMKTTAVFYNVGRGSTVDQYALWTAVRVRNIAAAYLDVTSPEPLDAENPLWTSPHVLLTPHSAGGYQEEFEVHVTHFLENLRRFARGEEPLDRVI
jgi:phosphoglycerate dehydrogenase-like enzyme